MIDKSDSRLRRRIAKDNTELNIINKTIYKIFEIVVDRYQFKYFLMVDYNGQSTVFAQWKPPESAYIGHQGDILFNDRVYSPNQMLEMGY